MFIDLLRKRRSIRSFDQRQIESDKIELLTEALLRSPTSKGRHPWEFILVTDPKIAALLSTAKPKGAGFLSKAPLSVVICGDPTISDVWIEDCAVAATIVQFAAEDLGLGSCWSQIRSRPHESGRSASAIMRQLLHLPEHLEVASIIGIGYPVAAIAAHSRDSLPTHKIHKNLYLRQ
jgi:nitroreductase